MAKFAINASGAMLLPSLVQVSESISGSVVPLAMFQSPPAESTIERIVSVNNYFEIIAFGASYSHFES